MAIELRQQLKLSQSLVMTPQLQQAIKLLQLNQLELVNLVQQELQENPVLEETETEEETEGERQDATEDDFGEPGEGQDEGQDADASGGDEGPSEVSLDDLQMAGDRDADGSSTEESGPSDAEKIADIEWEQYLDSNPMTGLVHIGVAGEDDRPAPEATYAP